jgi:hypothetical protein
VFEQIFNRNFFLLFTVKMCSTQALCFCSEDELYYVVNFVLISYNGSLSLRDMEYALIHGKPKLYPGV